MQEETCEDKKAGLNSKKNKGTCINMGLIRPSQIGRDENMTMRKLGGQAQGKAESMHVEVGSAYMKKSGRVVS